MLYIKIVWLEVVHGGLTLIDNKKIVKIRWIPSHGQRRQTRESMLIEQGLMNNSRVKLVDNLEDCDFTFLFYYRARFSEYIDSLNLVLPPEKTIVIDYHDNSHWFLPIECFAYFKRSWVEKVDKGNYSTKRVVSHSDHYYPLGLAIMDEFIIKEKLKRDIELSCTIRRRRHSNRVRLLEFLERMNIQGNIQMGQFNRGNMLRFNDERMRDYFKLLKRSRIVVTCNPSSWEGDHRTWEAFASGALVFVDKMYLPMIHPLVNYLHCIFYELSDKGLKNLQEEILYFMKHHKEAEFIARTGHEFTMKYHRASNRIDEILDAIWWQRCKKRK